MVRSRRVVVPAPTSCGTPSHHQVLALRGLLLAARPVQQHITNISAAADAIAIANANANTNAAAGPHRVRPVRVLVVVRTKSRGLRDGDGLIMRLANGSAAAGFQVRLFADNETVAPSQAAILAAFATSDVIVAPHGAGLSNIVVAPPCATVIEARASGHPACYKHLATVLGLAYEPACRPEPSTDAGKGNPSGLCPLAHDRIDADAARVVALVRSAVGRVRRHLHRRHFRHGDDHHASQPASQPLKGDDPHGACVANAEAFLRSHARATAEITRRRQRRT